MTDALAIDPPAADATLDAIEGDYRSRGAAAIGTALGIRTGTVSATLAAGIRSLRRMAEEVEL